MIRLAILTPTTPDRAIICKRMTDEIARQIQSCGAGDVVRHLFLNTISEKDGGLTTGAKRNELMTFAAELGAEYIAGFDSDDMPGENYIKLCLEGAASGLDCMELWGTIYFNGVKGPKPFHHSIEYDHWWEDDTKYARNPNHLNVIKLDCLKNIRYQDKTWGEDGHFSIDIQKAGVLKTMHPCKEVLYHYYSGWPKREIKSV